MRKNPFAVHFYREFNKDECIESNITIFYIIKGEAKIAVSEKVYFLREENFLTVNYNHSYTVEMMKDSLLMKINIDQKVFSDFSERNNLLFQCYDNGQQSSKYEKFRYRLNELLGEFTIEPAGVNYRKMSKLYNICDYMTRAFVISKTSARQPAYEEKTDKIFEYIEKNYQRKITLEDAADYMYMAPASFSRFFSRAAGITFVKYVTGIRLQHALTDLMSSDMSISDIAYKNGFGSVSQFNKQFKLFYHMSPHEYKNKADISEEDEEQTYDDLLVHDLEKYQNKTRLVVVKEQKIRIQEEQVDMIQGEEFRNPWGNLLHFGFASRLLSAAYQKQIIYLKQNLDFIYGAFNGVFSPEFELKAAREDEKLNFVNLDYVLDFLVENSIKPLIILDNQVFSMVKNLNDKDQILCRDVFPDEVQCCKVLGDMMDHIIYRYGIREVSSWKFEIWYDAFEKTILGLSKNFNIIWDQIYETIAGKIPGIKIGGCSLGTSVKQDISRTFYAEWKKAKHLPDFLTLNVFPYQTADDSSKMKAVRLKVEECFNIYMLNFKSILSELGYPHIPLVVLEWNLSFVQRNYFNDMAGKAAIMLAQLVQNINEADDVGYWPASDLYAGDYDANLILNGACGMISSDGICKPTFYALKFAKELQSIIVSRGDHYIVTKDGRGYFSVLLFNNKKLSYNYYSRTEASVGINDSALIFTDNDSLEVRLTMRGVPDKKYLVRKQVIGPEQGSVLDEWMKLGTEIPSSVSDVAYLKTRSVPLRKNEEMTVENGRLVIMETLKAHEIMLLQFI